MIKLINPTIAETKEAISNMPDVIAQLRADFDDKAFWDFEVQHTDLPIGENGTTVKQECLNLLNMCADAVARYELVIKDITKPNIKFVERTAYGDQFNRDCAAFIAATQRAEMKALWYNKMCRRITGKYFFTGRLPKENGSFTIEGMFAIAYMIFLMIDR